MSTMFFCRALVTSVDGCYWNWNSWGRPRANHQAPSTNDQQPTTNNLQESNPIAMPMPQLQQVQTHDVAVAKAKAKAPSPSRLSWPLPWICPLGSPDPLEAPASLGSMSISIRHPQLRWFLERPIPLLCLLFKPRSFFMVMLSLDLAFNTRTDGKSRTTIGDGVHSSVQ